MEFHNEEVLDTFRISYVHGEYWPHHVFATALYKLYDQDRKFVAKNSSTSHAEDEVLNHFEQLLTNHRLSFPKIKLFLSASPCSACSEKIIRFVYKTGLHVEIVFAGLYKITRPSCVRNSECRWHLHDSHTVNVDGLKKLYWTRGVVLRTFTEQDWLNLIEAMNVPYYNYCSRREEDLEVQMDFEEIMEIPPSASFPESALPTEPPMLERAFRGQTARGSSLYESHSRPFMCSFPNMHPQMNLSVYHDDGNYQSWDPGMHDTSTYPVTRPRDVDHMYTAHRAPAGRYMTMESDSDTRRSNYSYPFAFGHKHTSVEEWDKFM